MNNSASTWGLRIVLILAGIYIIFTGINIAFGGIRTLGWRFSNDFVNVTNDESFLTQDSHVRFLGGVWVFIGIIFFIAATDLLKFKFVLKFALIATFLGGLARFTQMNLSVTFGPNILAPLMAELIGMPLLYFWLSKVTKQSSPEKIDEAGIG